MSLSLTMLLPSPFKSFFKEKKLYKRKAYISCSKLNLKRTYFYLRTHLKSFWNKFGFWYKKLQNSKPEMRRLAFKGGYYFHIFILKITNEKLSPLIFRIINYRSIFQLKLTRLLSVKTHILFMLKSIIYMQTYACFRKISKNVSKKKMEFIRKLFNLLFLNLKIS